MNADLSSGLILFHRILPLLPANRLREVERLTGPPLRYPDASLQFEILDKSVNREVITSLGIHMMSDRIERTWMRNLTTFPQKRYFLYYSSDYERLIGPSGFGAIAGNKVWPGEHRLNDLLFTVWFKRRPGKNVREAFVRHLSDWLRAVSVSGFDTEGPVSAVEPEVEFRGRRANLRLNLERTGMHTVIWLILTMLEFGHSVAPVESATFNYDDPESERTFIECMHAQAKYTGATLTEDEIAKWRVDNSGGAGPSIRVPLLPMTEASQ